jgi:hypothetical protein
MAIKLFTLVIGCHILQRAALVTDQAFISRLSVLLRSISTSLTITVT